MWIVKKMNSESKHFSFQKRHQKANPGTIQHAHGRAGPRASEAIIRPGHRKVPKFLK
jgi:hypothetical protein